MLIQFTGDRKNILFTPETKADHHVLHNFPGLNNFTIHKFCPSILPVAFNLIERIRRAAKTTNLSPYVSAWLDQQFKLRPIPETFVFYTTPKDFQEIALRYLYTMGSAGILLDPGMGKSKVVLDYIRLMNFGKSVVVCPKPLMFVWEDEIRIHRPELTYHCVETTDWEKEKEAILNPHINVIIINYTKVVMMINELLKIKFDFIHLDEFLIKDPDTSRTKAITKLSLGIPYRCGGSGTLVTNTPLDMYAPVRYLQPALVGSSFSNFVKQFTVQRRVVDKNTGRARDQIVAFKGAKEAREILESCCIVMTKEQWLKLPDKIFHDVQVQLTDEQRDAYFSLLKNFRLDTEFGEVTVDNPLVMLTKLYQIANGFLYIQEEDEMEILGDMLPSEDIKKIKRDRRYSDSIPEQDVAKTKVPKSKRKIKFFKDPGKILKLKEIITTKLQGKKFLLWFNMDAERILIEQALEDLAIPYLMIKGGEKDVGGKVRQFNRDHEIQCLLCQAKSVNYGVTVMGTKKADLEDALGMAIPDIDTRVYIQVFYSMNFSLEVFLQQQDRTHRMNQEMPCEYYRIFANCTIEKRLKDILSDKMVVKQQMLVDVAKTIFSRETGAKATVSDEVEDLEEPPMQIEGIDCD